ncbi:MAG: ABC transporter ATP-binding protein [Candidatus Gastranaerophilales bacterium]|nr:ABC transporter ATP-binding protein [Candidatus Gastranaerophilales bacterium]
MKKLFEIKNLNMHYPVVDGLLGNLKGYVYALNNVDLDIYENEILGLVGESGSGKSTLGNCILKLLNPTSGEVIFENENILSKKKKELKDFRKKAQLIFQNPYMSLNPRMKIYDILKEPFIINGIKDKKIIEDKIKKIINLICMQEEVLNRYPHEFSGGQRQRIAIARAIILNPQFIVADEPVSALDVSIQAQIINLLIDLKEHLNLTMLFISHDLSVIKFISDRIAVMYLGEIVEIADKNELFNNHKHPYTEALLNAVPVISEDKGKKIILSGDLPSPQNPPKGCKFHTRCPYVMDKCKCNQPELKEISENHKVRCFLAQEIL